MNQSLTGHGVSSLGAVPETPGATPRTESSARLDDAIHQLNSLTALTSCTETGVVGGTGWASSITSSARRASINGPLHKLESIHVQ
eukprot:424919-Amphidinium_carterae.1